MKYAWVSMEIVSVGSSGSAPRGRTIASTTVAALTSSSDPCARRELPDDTPLAF